MKFSLRAKVRQAALVALSSLTVAGVGYVFAAPSAPPPGSSIPLPLHVGSAAQTKAGPLTVQGALTASGGLSAPSGTITTLNASTICLGGDCKTSWPTGGGGSSTVNGAGYHSSQYCYGYNSYEQQNYYYNGYLYSGNYTYNCGQTSFSFTVSSSIPSGRTPSSVVSGTVWCHAGGSNYYYYGSPNSYVTDGYYQWRVAGTVTSIVNNNNGTVTINGTCKFTTAGYYSYNYIGMRAENLTFLYN